MLRSFLRFFTVLIVVESITFAVTMLLLDYAVQRWTNSKAQALAVLAPDIARQFESAAWVRLRPGDTQAPEYRHCLEQLGQLEKAHYPKGGCTFAIFEIKQGEKGPWLSLLVGESPPYDPATPATEPQESVSLPVKKAVSGEVGYTSIPYGGFGYQYELSAYAPIHNSNGKVQAVLAVDYDVSSLNDLREVTKTAFVWAVFPATLLAVVVACFLAYRFVDPFEFLRIIHAIVGNRKPEGQTVEAALQLAAAPSGVGAVVMPATPPEDASRTDPKQGTPTSNTQKEPPENDALWKSLTPREKEVVLCLGQGLTNKKIAEKLFVTEETVKKHLKNVFAKLGVTNRTEAALYGVGKGAMTWEPPPGHGQ